MLCTRLTGCRDTGIQGYRVLKKKCGPGNETTPKQEKFSMPSCFWSAHGQARKETRKNKKTVPEKFNKNNSEHRGGTWRGMRREGVPFGCVLCVPKKNNLQCFASSWGRFIQCQQETVRRTLWKLVPRNVAFVTEFPVASATSPTYKAATLATFEQKANQKKSIKKQSRKWLRILANTRAGFPT